MNALILLMGLLVLSYVGSFLVGGRAIRGFGLPSGCEYVLLGVAIGPDALGLVDRSILEVFEPLAYVALGWLAFVLGLDYAFIGARRLTVRRYLVANFIVLLTGGLVAAAVYLVAGRFTPLCGIDQVLVAGGVGAACAQTTRHAVRWVVERHRADGPLAALLGELSDSDDLIPLLALAVLFALAPTVDVRLAFPPMGWAGITVALGVVVGLIAAVLLGREFRLHESWGVLLGTSLFAIGMAARLHLSVLSMMFFMGLAVAGASRHRAEVAAMVEPTERPVLLPALLLAGARVNPRVSPHVGWILGAALLARIVAKLLAGLFLYGTFAPARRAGAGLGLGLLSAGAMAMTIGLAFALRFPGEIGDTVLVTVAVVTVFGEFVGPTRLRAALTSAGEIVDPRSTPPSPPAPAPAPDAPVEAALS